MSSNTTYYHKFSFYSNRHWLYNYLLNFKDKNKSLADVKEDSINKLEEIFRQKGYGQHIRDNWLKCAQEKKCLNECRDSNGFKNIYDIRFNRKKCVPYTRKINPKYKPDNKSWDSNNIYQYAYYFLTSYNSIVYTLNNWKKLQRNISKSSNKNELNDNDKIIQYIVTSYSSNIIEKILNGINIFRNEDYERLVEKMKSTGLINDKPFNYPKSNYNPYPRYDPYTYTRTRKGELDELGAFDKRADELSNKNTLSTPSTLVGGKNKSRKYRKNKKQHKTKKHNKSNKQRKTRKYRKSKR